MPYRAYNDNARSRLLFTFSNLYCLHQIPVSLILKTGVLTDGIIMASCSKPCTAGKLPGRILRNCSLWCTGSSYIYAGKNRYSFCSMITYLSQRFLVVNPPVPAIASSCCSCFYDASKVTGNVRAIASVLLHPLWYQNSAPASARMFLPNVVGSVAGD